MFTFRYLARFGAEVDGWSMASVLLPVSLGTREFLLAGSSAFGRYNVLDIGLDLAAPLSAQTIAAPTGSFLLDDAAAIQMADGLRLYSASRTGTQIDVQRIGADGTLTALTPLTSVGGAAMKVSALEGFSVNGVPYLAVGAYDRTTLNLLRLPANGPPTVTTQLEDTPKTTLDGVSDMASLTIGDRVFLAVAASRDDGLTLFEVDATGDLQMSDALTAKDGLWVDGLDVVAAATLGGTQFLIAGSIASSSLSVIRVNAAGVMFVTDQVLDTLETRFGGVDQIAVVPLGERCLVLAAGGDGGITLMELLPDGRLFHHTSLEARGNWSAFADGVTGLAARQDGAALDVFAAGSGGVVQFEVPLTSLGTLLRGTPRVDVLTGGAGDDLIFGDRGRDTLSGGGGDDVLMALSAGTTLSGGPGSDIFRPGAGGAVTVITDFEPGRDRIDLADWGRLYDISALTIRGTPDGAEILFGTNTLDVTSRDGATLAPGTWDMSDFLF